MDDDEQTRKDTSYSPASERETAEKQEDYRGQRPAVLPGTGGPDDSGDLDTATEDLHMPDRGDPE